MPCWFSVTISKAETFAEHKSQDRRHVHRGWQGSQQHLLVAKGGMRDSEHTYARRRRKRRVYACEGVGFHGHVPTKEAWKGSNGKAATERQQRKGSKQGKAASKERRAPAGRPHRRTTASSAVAMDASSVEKAQLRSQLVCPRKVTTAGTSAPATAHTRTTQSRLPDATMPSVWLNASVVMLPA
jgi:hypothetical protein